MERRNRSGIRKHGNRWQWSVTLGGQRFWGSEETKAAAVQARSDAISKAGKGEWIAPSKLTLSEYWEKEYLPGAERGLKVNTIKNYSDLWKWRIEPYLGKALLTQITPGRISGWLTKLEEGGRKDGGALSAVSVQHAFVLLGVVLGHAVSHGVLSQNACQKLEHKPTRDGDKGEREWWDAPTLRSFLSDEAVVGNRIYPLVVFLLDTGVRRGELCGLRWSSVNLGVGTGSVVIERSRVRVSGVQGVDGSSIYEGAPKSRKGKPKVRTLSLSEPAVAALRAWRGVQGQERLSVGAAWAGEDFVFTTPVRGPGVRKALGGPMSPEGVSQAWNRIRDRWLASRTGVELPRPSIHEVRHSYASVMVAAGEHLMTVAARLGHRDTRMVDAVYGHLAPGADREAASRVAGLLHSQG